MKEIILFSGEKCLVDDEDYEELSKFRWRLADKYVRRNIGDKLIHRIIMNSPKGLEIDHIDGNRLNNQKSN